MDDYDDRAISRAIREGRYNDAIKLIRPALREFDQSHWLMACLSTCYYEKRDYKRAVKWAWKAADIAPNCALSLWYYSSALDQLGRTCERETTSKWCLDTAEKTYKGMLSFGWRYLAGVEPCGEGERWTKAVLNDVRYRLALIYWHRKEHKLALKWAKLHLRMRAAGVKSIYTKKQILRDVHKIEQEINNVPRTSRKKLRSA